MGPPRSGHREFKLLVQRRRRGEVRARQLFSWLVERRKRKEQRPFFLPWSFIFWSFFQPLLSERAEIGGSSPRPISTGQLKRLPAFHLQPIKQVLFLRPYPLSGVRSLILGGASRLDAFSAYPGRTWLPSVCPGRDNWYTIGPSTAVFSYWRQLPANFLRPRRIGTELSHDVLNPARVPL